MPDKVFVTETMLTSLNASRPWGQLLAVLGFVFTILLIFAGLALTLAFTAAPSRPQLALFLGPAFAIIYLVLAIFFCLIPSFLLLRSVSAISRVAADGPTAIEELFDNQTVLWKYFAIFAVIMLILLVAVLVGGAMVALA